MFETISEAIDHCYSIHLSSLTTKQLLFLAEAATYAAAEGDYCLESAIQDLRLEVEFPLCFGKAIDSWIDSVRDVYEPMLIYTALAIKCGIWVFTRYPQEIESAAPSWCA